MSNEEKNNKNCDERRFIIFREESFPDGRKDRFILHIDGWYHCKNEEEGFYGGGDKPNRYTRYEAEKIIKNFEKGDTTKRPLYYMKELKYFKEIEKEKYVCDKKNK